MRTIESELERKNALFDDILASFLLSRGYKNEQIINDYSYHFYDNVTYKDFENSKKDCKPLEAYISNFFWRKTGGYLSLEDDEKIVTQLFWKRFREFAIDYVSKFDKDDFLELIISLGRLRYVFNEAFANAKPQHDDWRRGMAFDKSMMRSVSFKEYVKFYPEEQSSGKFGAVVIIDVTNFYYESKKPTEEITYSYEELKNESEARLAFEKLVNSETGGYRNIPNLIENCIFLSKKPISKEDQLFSNIQDILKNCPKNTKISKILIDFDSQDGCYITLIDSAADSKIIYKFFSEIASSEKNKIPFMIGKLEMRRGKDEKEEIIRCSHPGILQEGQTSVAPAPNLPHSTETATSTPNESRTASETSSASPSAARPESGAGTAGQTSLLKRLACLFKIQEKDVFYQKLNEFISLFINIQPFARGSASIGEWIMYGLAKRHSINLGKFNTDNKLSSDIPHPTYNFLVLSRNC